MGARFWGRVAWHREQTALQKVRRATPPGYHRQVPERAELGQARVGSDWAPPTSVLSPSAHPEKSRPRPQLTLPEAMAFQSSSPYVSPDPEEPISQERRLRPTEVNGTQGHGRGGGGGDSGFCT